MTAGRDYLGTYRLVRLVRSGQTCQVWDAVDDATQRRVAIKLLQQEYRKDREQINYLKHELVVAKNFKHPAVIEVYDYGQVSGIPHLVLELFHSKNLKQALRNGPEELAPHIDRVLVQAAEGLAYMHEQGWIHCDVKPDNFLLNDQWQVKLIDFALARKQRRGLAKLLGGSKTAQGTRSYMSPEQIRTEPLDFRADIYSFGCMAYELLCGKPPYAASSPNELLTKHLRAPVPSAVAVNSNFTQDVADLLSATMAKQRERRPDTMQEFLSIFKRLRVFKVRPRAEGEPEDPQPT